MSSDHSSRARLFRDALHDTLAVAATPGAGADPMALLHALLSRCRVAGADEPGVADVLAAFESIARRTTEDDAVSEATALFESPQRFREALFFLRCLDRDATGALALNRARSYLSAAVAPPAAFPELATDQAALLDATTFEGLWQDPARLGWMEGTIQIWRRAYVPVYATHHADYNRHIAAIATDVDAAAWQTDALAKLNTLARLGEPVAQPALVRYHALAQLFACPLEAVQLTDALKDDPVCGHCGFRLGDAAPIDALNTTLVAIERGLAEQRTRLAQRVVGRLLARPGRAQEDRLDRFIQVVQAADLSGLAQVLDDGLLAFLDDLLLEPEPRVNLIDRLGRDFPELTAANLEAAVAAFRVLAEDELARGGGRIAIGREDTS
jgi:hypothetical protein